MVIKTTEGANYNAIDPDFIVDKNGKTWMTFGSWWTGIQLIEIDPATGKQSGDNKNVYNIANRGGDGIEGPSIVYTNGYYYLFTAWDVCCEGVNSTYRTMVGRAQEITGPYSDRNGRSCLDGYAEEFLTSYGRYYGPGGGSVFKDGRFYRFVHHYYNGNRDGAPQLQIRDIVWDTDDWPLSGQPFLGRYLSLETEHAHLTNVEIRTSNQASNGEYVGMINYDDSKLIFPVNIPAAGQYRLQVRYANGDDDATLKIRVNNGNIQDLDCPSTGSYGIFPEGYVAFIDVQLQEGGNIIEFTKGINFSELDRIDIQRDGYTTIPATGFDNFSGITAEKSGTINYIADIDADDYAFFENIIFDTELETAIFRCANNSGDGVIEIRLDDAGGEMIGSCTITSTGSWDTWIDYSFSISQVSGVHDIYLIFKGNGDDLFRIENFHFAKEETAILSRYKNAKYNQFNRMTGRNQIVVVTDILGRELYRGYYSELSKSTFYRNRIGSGLYFITQYDGSIKKISKKMTLLGN